ncbi:LPXTG cell wall anchor domain-containing protein [Lactiplantibacillus paraplantarum]|uniref:LPXTG cell wall anchor domain-containing protein n=1 Tax=Lactiplantibacillus paraplantarum TaxID=60520 RepID=UPI0021A343ED
MVTKSRQAIPALRTTVSPVVAKPVAERAQPRVSARPATLPQTGEQTNRALTVMGLILLTATSLLGFSRQRQRHQTTD